MENSLAIIITFSLRVGDHFSCDTQFSVDTSPLFAPCQYFM